MHLTEGQIKAYIDHELSTADKELVKAHLASCRQCSQQADLLAAQAREAHDRLSMLAPSPARVPRLSVARARLQTRILDKEKQTMLQRIFAPRYRLAWAVLGVILVLGVALAFPPVQAIANSFLGLFRVQQFTVVQVNPGELPNQLSSSPELETMLANNVHVEEQGEPQEVASPAEASQLAGIPVRLPVGMNSQPSLKVMPGAHMSFDVDLNLARALLNEIGRSDIQLPDDLDGASVQVDVGSTVTAMYGKCNFDVEQARREGYDPDNPRLPSMPNCTVFAQMPSPTISAPPGLDLQQIGEAFLQMLGMPQQDAAKFAQTVDWGTTLVVPIPRNGTSYQEIMVDGVSGTLITQDIENHSPQYLVIWIKDGILYSLTGQGNGRQGLQLANSLE